MIEENNLFRGESTSPYMLGAKAGETGAEQFLDLLHPDLTEAERIEIRYKTASGGMMRQYYSRSAREAIRVAASLRSCNDVYFGVATRRGENGTKTGVSKVGALWADLDIKADKKPEDLMGQLQALLCQPSAIVNSGNGYHCYWLLGKPIVDDVNFALAERTMQLLAIGLDGDPVHDRSRILRLPGTFNRKYVPARPVALDVLDVEKRFGLDELHEMAQSLTTSSNKPQQSGGSVETYVLAQPITEGGRNLALTSVAGSLRHRGLDAESIRIVLLEVNRTRCIPPIGDDEVSGIARSVGKYKAGSPKYVRSSAKRVFPKGKR